MARTKKNNLTTNWSLYREVTKPSTNNATAELGPLRYKLDGVEVDKDEFDRRAVVTVAKYFEALDTKPYTPIPAGEHGERQQ
jgi:hypothetical protein